MPKGELEGAVKAGKKDTESRFYLANVYT